MTTDRNASRPAQDHTGEPLFHPNAHPAPALDAQASRAEYNRNNGRVPSAPTVGGDSHGKRSPRGMPPGAPSAKRIKPID